MRPETVTLRTVGAEDCRCIFDWRNLPEIVARGSHRSVLVWADHVNWFARVIASADYLLFIIEADRQPVGHLRFEHRTARTARVSIFLDPATTGRGLGVRALEAGARRVFCRWPEVQEIEALVRTDNDHSIRAFRKAGYSGGNAASDGDLRMVCPRPPPVPHNRLTWDERDADAVAAAVRSGYWAGGRSVSALEAQCAALAVVRAGVAVASGFSALRLGLHALGISPGDAVLIPAYCCVALPNAVLALGACPVPVDVKYDLTIDPACCRSALLRHPAKAILAVHTFGARADLAGLGELGVPVVEDCAHAFGTLPEGVGFGGGGTLTVLSFHATKLVGAGEGGMVLSNEAALIDCVRRTRSCTDQGPSAVRMNDCMSELEAALALAQLQRLPEFVERRRQVAHRYLDGLASCPGWILPEREARIWYRFVAEAPDTAGEVVARLRRCGVLADEPWPDWRGDEYRSEPTPVADRAYAHRVSLPIYPTLSAAEQSLVIDSVLTNAS